MKKIIIFVLFLAMLAYAGDISIKVLAMDKETPEGKSVEGVTIGIYDAVTKELIISSTTTGEGLSAPESAKLYSSLIKDVALGKKNFYFYGSKNGKIYLENYPPRIYSVDILSRKICVVDTNECQSIYDANGITFVLREKIEEIPASKTAAVTIFVMDDDTTQGKSVEGVYVKVIDAETKETFSSAVTNGEGLKIELPLDKKFEFLTQYSKNGKDYGAFQATNNVWRNSQFYIKGSDSNGDFRLCKDSELCSKDMTIILKPLNLMTKEDGDEINYNLNLSKGWNLVSVPLKQPEIVENNCDNIRIYFYDSNLGKFRGFLLDAFHLPMMKAFWIKATGSCSIKLSGSPLKNNEIDGLILNQGWNMIGATDTESMWENIKGNCNTKGSLWSYDSQENKWVNVESLVPGKGHFVKLTERCSLAGNY